MDDVIVRLELLAQHADRIRNFVLTVHIVMLDNRVNIAVLLRQWYIAGDFFDLVEVFEGNFHLLIRYPDRAAIVQTLDVRARDREENSVDLNIAPLLCPHESIV